MDNETISSTPFPTENGCVEQTETSLSPVYVTNVAFLAEDDERSMRITVQRDLSVTLTSFTVSYRFAALSKGGNLTKSRFFRLRYDREGVNTKETIAIRVRIPEGYHAVGASAMISEIEYPDDCENFSPDDENALLVSGTASGVNLEKLEKKSKKLSKKAKAWLIAGISVAAALLLVVGGIWYSKYSSIMKVANALIDDGKYGEAYKVTEVCAPSFKRTVCANIVTKALALRDYKTAYAYSSLIGRENNVFKRVEYEIVASGADALESDALAVLKKLEDDEEYDRAMADCIEKMCEDGNYPAAMTAVNEMRNETERNLLRSRLLVDGVCYYSATSAYRGIAKYDRAFEFFEYYKGANEESARLAARDIVNRCIAADDAAGAVVLSSYFCAEYESFEIKPSSITVTPQNSSIAHSLDYAYPLLTDEQKRAYHTQILALSENAYFIRNGVIAGTDVKDAVSVATYENRAAVLHQNGQVTHISNNNHNTVSSVPKNLNAVQVAVGLSHTVILQADGTVLAVGDNTRGQCNVSEWKDIVEIAAGRYFTLGLRSDGRVLACGSDKCGQGAVDSLANVISIRACDSTAVALFYDGTVILRGNQSLGLYEANNFTNVKQIEAGGNTVIAELEDGTYRIADGSASVSSGDVREWRADEITSFAVGSQCIAWVDGNNKVTVTGEGAPR